MYGTAPRQQWARDGIAEFDVREAFKRVGVRVVVVAPMGKQFTAMASRNEVHAPVRCSDVLQGHPNANLRVIEIGMEGVILMPRRSCAVMCRLEDRMRENGLRSRPQQLLGDGQGVGPEERMAQARFVIFWVADLHRPAPNAQIIAI